MRSIAAITKKYRRIATDGELTAFELQGVAPALTELLAYLRAQQILYHALHWQSSGPTGYADHLLFERLYNSVTGQLDTLGEKMVALVGEQHVDPLTQLPFLTEALQSWSASRGVELTNVKGIPEPLARALRSEKDLRTRLRQVFTALQELKALSYGLNDYLMGLDNEHETNEYLLKQRSK